MFRHGMMEYHTYIQVLEMWLDEDEVIHFEN